MIGLFFGETNFPKEILKRLKKKKINFTIIDLTKDNSFKKEKNSYRVSIGQFGKILKILKKEKCKQVLFAGKVNKPKLSKLKLDLKGIYYIPKIIKSAKKGDVAILKSIIQILKIENIKVISSLKFNPDLTLKKGIHTKLKPNKKNFKDINLAIKFLNKTNMYNFTQGAIVRNEKLISIEGKNGTEQMIKKCKKINNELAGVLVKYPKKKQDLRIDLPTVGLKTLVACKKAGIKGLVLKANQNVFLERFKCINYANKNRMFLLAK